MRRICIKIREIINGIEDKIQLQTSFLSNKMKKKITVHESRSEKDKTLSIEGYLNIFRPCLKDIINQLKKIISVVIHIRVS